MNADATGANANSPRLYAGCPEDTRSDATITWGHRDRDTCFHPVRLPLLLMPLLAISVWVAALLFPLPLSAQGFASLGQTAQGFAMPDPDRTFEFPHDHGAHPAFRIEWWYMTANLTAADGSDYGVQWTLFRTTLGPETLGATGWRPGQAWLGHAGLTTPDAHFSAQRRARGGLGLAGVTAAPFVARIDDWYMRAGTDGISNLSVHAAGARFAFDLALSAQGPLVFHGTNGFSVKSHAGHASHYYSQPFFSVTGRLTLPAGPVEVKGMAWLDREWSSQPLASDQSGWDWVSLHLDTGAKLMAFRLRHMNGETYHSGTYVTAAGQSRALAADELALVPVEHAQVAGRPIPVRWHLSVPALAIDVETTALNPDSWMNTTPPYWEGPVTASGSHSGRGYVEMTGYE